jgi:hypothetical protein
MDLELVNQAFRRLINKRGVYKDLGTSAVYIRSLRHRLKNGLKISTDVKLLLLKKSGWNHADKIFDRHDMVDLVRYVLKQGPSAQSFGAEYLVDKWENRAVHAHSHR